VSLGASAASGAPSHVLAAMGVEPELARSALRFSLGHSTTRESIDCVLSYLREALCSPLLAGA
jgi:cysteine desulfurase